MQKNICFFAGEKEGGLPLKYLVESKTQEVKPGKSKREIRDIPGF